MSLNVRNTTLQTLFSIYVSLLLGVVLIPNCISLLQCFQLTGLRLSFFLICDPPRPRTVWLVHRSVVPYRSLFSLRHFCLLVPSLSTLNWPLGPATVCRSSRGSLLIDQTYHPSPSDLSLTGYFTAQASFYLAAFFTPYTHWSFYRSQFFGCVYLVAFLGALCLPLGCPLPVIWVAGSLLAVSNLPAVHLCFYCTGLGPFFLGGALLFWRPPGCRQPHFARFFAQPVVPACQWRLPWVAFLTPFFVQPFGRSRGVGPLSAVHTGDFPVVIFLHNRNLPTSRLLGVGTRAPRVLPPPAWDLSAIGN